MITLKGAIWVGLTVPVALGLLLTGCSTGPLTIGAHSASPAAHAHAKAGPSPSPTKTAPPTSMSFPRHVGKYRLVTLKGRPAARAASNPKFVKFFRDAATAAQAAYMPGHNFDRAIVVTGGQIRPGVDPAAAIEKYIIKVKGSNYGVRSEPTGPLGGQAKSWLFGGVVYCMWADAYTYGLLLNAPQGSVSEPISKLASEMLIFRHAMELVRR